MKSYHLIALVFVATYLFIILPACLCSCQKQEKHKYQVTYTFESDQVPYTIQTWTPSTSFSWTVQSGTYSRTEVYDTKPLAGFQASISAPGAGYKRITITVDGVATSCSDTLFNTLSCQGL